MVCSILASFSISLNVVIVRHAESTFLFFKLPRDIKNLSFHLKPVRTQRCNSLPRPEVPENEPPNQKPITSTPARSQTRKSSKGKHTADKITGDQGQAKLPQANSEEIGHFKRVILALEQPISPNFFSKIKQTRRDNESQRIDQIRLDNERKRVDQIRLDNESQRINRIRLGKGSGRVTRTIYSGYHNDGWVDRGP